MARIPKWKAKGTTQLQHRPNARTRKIYNGPGLDALTAELYLKIIGFLNLARDIASLSRTCRTFQLLNDNDGWRGFCRQKFPTLMSEKHGEGGEYWHELARRLTGFSAGWDRRCISANWLDELHTEHQNSCRMVLYDDGQTKEFDPRGTSSTDELLPPRQRQTLDYQAHVVSRAEHGSAFKNEDLVVAWSTGSTISVRTMSIRGPNKSLTQKYLINAGCYIDGRDDVTTLSLVGPDNQRPVELIVGRADGDLQRLEIDNEEKVTRVKNTYHCPWTKQAIRASDISTSQESLLAAISETNLSIWNVDSTEHAVTSLSNFSFKIDAEPSARAWSVKFVAGDKLVAGMGQVEKPVTLFEVTPTGLKVTSKFGLEEAENQHVGASFSPNYRKRCVYAIEPVPLSSRAGGSLEGQTFLAGWYDGFCRLYDTRSYGPVLSYHDPIDSDSAVYSLAAYGRESFVAGTANGILKFFDFRMGYKAYYYSDAQHCSKDAPYPTGASSANHDEYRRKRHQPDACRGVQSMRHGTSPWCEYHSRTQKHSFRPNMNMFLYGRSSLPNNERHQGLRPARNAAPIYSLSIPSTEFPLIYAGTQGTVYELEVKSNVDSFGIPLSMYETSAGVGDAISEKERRMVPILRTQCLTPDPPRDRRSSSQEKNLSRLSVSWLTPNERI